MSYQVFIDGTKVPGNLNLVAGAIGQRYGLPPETLVQRMSAGRFRVKKDIDLATARQFAAELDSLGAVASIVDASGKIIGSGADAAELDGLQLMPEQPSLSAKLSAVSPPKSDSPLAGITSERKAQIPDSPLAGITAERKAQAPDSPFAGITSERKAVQETTGLAAAASASGEQDLGALQSASDSLSLSSIDGEVQATPAADEVGPSKAVPVADEAAFLPPEATSAAPVLEVEAVLPERREPEPEPAREAVFADDGAGDVVAGGDATLGEGRTQRDSILKRLWDALDDDHRKRLALGVLLVTLVGIVPMHLYATMSENDYYSKMRKDLAETQALVQDVEEWNNLEPLRKEVAERMDKKRVNIAITSGLIWLIVAGGLGFLYFRKLPWADLGPRLARHDDEPGGGVAL
ncbi:MAG: hypothetical protein KJO07_20895 [Deltaproteobacteria bacterium]|nr:hypothetical protein [Deltaproteobacteria bacterium]